jgi:transcriptional regulator with XRE-family HTH domain
MNNLEIKELRISLKLKQQEFADLVGVSKSAVQKWEGGERTPDDIQLRKLQEITQKHTDINNIAAVEPYELHFTKNSNANHFTRLPNGQYYMSMPLAEHNIQAGFLDTYQDLESLREVSQHGIIVNKPAKGRYIAFRVKGDSMDDGTTDAIPQNHIVSTRELQRQHWTNPIRYKDYRFWVIYTTESKYPLLKEIIGHDAEKGIITCHSLNDSPEYRDFELSLNDVQALFYVISIQRDVAKDYY